MKVVLATRNQGKVAELRRILDGIDVVGLGEFPDAPEVPETELTFAGNALLKARAIAAHTGLPAVADDSGLCVDAMNGMPGIFSARWAGRHGDDQANLDLLLGQLADVAPEHRGARFVCAAAIAWPSGEEDTVEGTMDGVVIDAPRGTNGFGYDPIFVPEGDTRTNSELSAEEKDAISHRGKAFTALAARILARVDHAG
ncbi:RdgB/HAM1 family non-canonical purine NTP pyrophosphatase [Actinoallomurus soli]|uniref:RdgB/HAM1 family non-canonical purine NTP pyrophosphatase n=1 Tax=Actinoallomurus soli TaxID=2952535 RepID=UPI002093C933|nr:RdgB/HAM1 family non-canonical purine NTP pyrophosphatase [Actinoallomurus soli]MCO5971498.1 RdgB/HAM1 family non-canonical purine NTP pyrophosphatase [Actinoallomurus soli]